MGVCLPSSCAIEWFQTGHLLSSPQWLVVVVGWLASTACSWPAAGSLCHERGQGEYQTGNGTRTHTQGLCPGPHLVPNPCTSPDVIPVVTMTMELTQTCSCLCSALPLWSLECLILSRTADHTGHPDHESLAANIPTLSFSLK